jgi:hypothetical protein
MAEDRNSSKNRPDKSELVNEAMRRFGIPSYEAWAMTVEDLTKKLKES